MPEHLNAPPLAPEALHLRPLEQAATAELFFDEHGSLPDVHMMNHFGMSSEEGRQEVKFGQWTGTVAQMLTDPRCPVGAMVHNAHVIGGVEGVQRALDGLKMMAPEVEVIVSPKSDEYYNQVGAINPNSKKK